MKIMTIPPEFKWIDKTLEELNALPEKDKKSSFKKEENKDKTKHRRGCTYRNLFPNCM